MRKKQRLPISGARGLQEGWVWGLALSLRFDLEHDFRMKTGSHFSGNFMLYLLMFESGKFASPKPFPTTS